jgi:hypothetical protein
MKALLLCNRPSFGSNASTISDHLDALSNLPNVRTYELSTVKIIPRNLNLDIFDIIIIHYTIQLGEFNDHFLNKEARERINRSRGLKVVFIQDEYREAFRVHKALTELNVTLLFTLLSSTDAEIVYPSNILPKLEIKRVLAAYVPDRLLKMKLVPLSHRRVLVSYRARKMPIWLGSLALEKWQIAVTFLASAKASEKLIGHQIDISWHENQRLYGKKWYALLNNSRCVLGVESGANILDTDGSLKSSVECMLLDNNNDEELVYDKLVRHRDNALHMNQIAARHFEACALGTVQILFEGNYSNILVPYLHYLPLKKDFSNFNELVDIMLDDHKIQEISMRAREDIALSKLWSYNSFSQTVSKELHALVANTSGFVVSRSSYSGYRFIFESFSSFTYLLFRLSSSALGTLLKIQPLRGALVTKWHSFDEGTKKKLRPILSMIGR